MHACVCASVPPRDPSASAAGILGFASLPLLPSRASLASELRAPSAGGDGPPGEVGAISGSCFYGAVPFGLARATPCPGTSFCAALWAKWVFWLPCAAPAFLWASDSVLRISVAFRVYSRRVELRRCSSLFALLLGSVGSRPRLLWLCSILAVHFRLEIRYWKPKPSRDGENKTRSRNVATSPSTLAGTADRGPSNPSATGLPDARQGCLTIFYCF